MIIQAYQDLRAFQTSKRDQLKQLKREYELTRLQINVLKDQQRQIEEELSTCLDDLQVVGEMLDAISLNL